MLVSLLPGHPAAAQLPPGVYRRIAEVEATVVVPERGIRGERHVTHVFCIIGLLCYVHHTNDKMDDKQEESLSPYRHRVSGSKASAMRLRCPKNI